MDWNVTINITDKNGNELIVEEDICHSEQAINPLRPFLRRLKKRVHYR